MFVSIPEEILMSPMTVRFNDGTGASWTLSMGRSVTPFKGIVEGRDRIRQQFAPRRLAVEVRAEDFNRICLSDDVRFRVRLIPNAVDEFGNVSPELLASVLGVDGVDVVSNFEEMTPVNPNSEHFIWRSR